ncbi:MAG TPA: hypothetical protein VGV91_15595, partial [Rubrobacter sp.]|nr:hypothetical protein [Rubrobacter sp.]
MVPGDVHRRALQGQARVIGLNLLNLGLDVLGVQLVGQRDPQCGPAAVVVGRVGVRVPEGVPVGGLVGVGLALDVPRRRLDDLGAHGLATRPPGLPGRLLG